MSSLFFIPVCTSSSRIRPICWGRAAPNACKCEENRLATQRTKKNKSMHVSQRWIQYSFPLTVHHQVGWKPNFYLPSGNLQYSEVSKLDPPLPFLKPPLQGRWWARKEEETSSATQAFIFGVRQSLKAPWWVAWQTSPLCWDAGHSKAGTARSTAAGACRSRRFWQIRR